MEGSFLSRGREAVKVPSWKKKNQELCEQPVTYSESLRRCSFTSSRCFSL